MKVRQAVYDTYWYFAAERQNIFFNKLKVGNRVYTKDHIFQQYKFCNTYRASDRVSQFLIKDVIYRIQSKPEDTLFRIFLFRLLNKISTWQELEKRLGTVTLDNFNPSLYASTLEDIRKVQPIYGNAFILCATKAFGFDKKHENHLALLEYVFKSKRIDQKLLHANSLQGLFTILKTLPLIGDFMAYQIAIDLNYSELFTFSENDFTIAGPGADRGIRKCFTDTGGKSTEYIIQYMVENQDNEFSRLGIKFKNLFGRKLHAIDCQGLFCETDKYARVKFAELKSNRKKIKAKYKKTPETISYFYPPKWNLKFN